MNLVSPWNLPEQDTLDTKDSKMDYKEAGVDIEKGNQFVDRIKSLMIDMKDDRVVDSIGGFSALYKMDEDRYISAATDGVGTKLLLAIETEIFDSIGFDLVGMCVNDLICNGSRPLFFLDYFATGKLNLDTSEKVLAGIIEACKEAGCFLIGGETAEMPDLYSEGHFDLAGFAIGEVYKKDLLSADKVQVGHKLVSVASSGFHSNGYSLVRKLVKEDETQLKKDLLAPTKLYVKSLQKIREQQPNLITGLANITGGGIENIERMNPKLKYRLDQLPSISELPKAMQCIIDRSGLNETELYKTFNMGMGMVLATNDTENLITDLRDLDLKAQVIGEVV
ncbi:MAG: phosphoribosylformylglycinamidine cyclo-ligase [Bdellovibrionota bacterium]|nr:phosphoribosylformylglycinamidine cyclo-ligase [Bdellovibrionota bacterium]